MVHPSIPARNVSELVAIAKAKPLSLNYASSGVGSTQHLAGEKLKALAVTTPQRASQPAQVPTLLEAGLKGFEMTNWYGVMGPAKLPRDIVTRLNTEINRIMALPDAKARLEEVGTQLNPITPEQFEKFLGAEITQYARLIKTAGVTVE